LLYKKRLHKIRLDHLAYFMQPLKASKITAQPDEQAGQINFIAFLHQWYQVEEHYFQHQNNLHFD
jgi:hypothetical protein